MDGEQVSAPVFRFREEWEHLGRVLSQELESERRCGVSGPNMFVATAYVLNQCKCDPWSDPNLESVLDGVSRQDVEHLFAHVLPCLLLEWFEEVKGSGTREENLCGG